MNLALSNANGHITLNTPVLVRSLKLKVILSPVSTWMGDRLGTLDAVGFSFCSFFHYFCTLGRVYLWTCQTYCLWRDFATKNLVNLLLLTLMNSYSLETLNFQTEIFQRTL